MGTGYRSDRMLFLNPWNDGEGGQAGGFQLIHSYYAFSQGGLFGVGLGNSREKFYLPEAETDFIFAVFAEEFGFIGCVLLIGLFLSLIHQGVRIARSKNDPFLSYVAVGLIALFAIQVMINLGVVVGLFPVTGITLPFISYGGSSLVVMMSAMGLLIAVANQ